MGLGRTPAQCIEKYNQIKDELQGNDYHQLREREMNEMIPESRPALKDRVDLDVDEIEMLNEARARLANTKGKKAKRKERQKDEKERMYALDVQKKKELKEIGIHYVGSTKKGLKSGKKDVIDYNSEIPFYRNAPEGPYSVEKERKPPKQPSFLGKEMK